MATQTEYTEYLRIDSLLELQQPLTPAADDELLFIIVHQSYELWFKLILHELRRGHEALMGNRLASAVAAMQRVTRIENLLLEHLSVLETMSPERFLEFRDPLAPASGFQSQQFRQIEELSGSNATQPEPSNLYGALCQCLALNGLPMPLSDSGEAKEQRLTSLSVLYRHHEQPERALLHQICELLVDHDELVARWRHHHALMAAREIGSRQGTGGSLGVDYLQSTLGYRFFPELWQVRTHL